MATIKEVVQPKWEKDAVMYYDEALTGVSLNNLQQLLDDQSNTAACLQLAYLSTSSIPTTQNRIREVSRTLWQVDTKALTVMGNSYATASTVMTKVPQAFKMLSKKSTIVGAEVLLKQLADEAKRIEKDFADVARKYQLCADSLSKSFEEGNIQQAGLKEELQRIKASASSAQVYADQYGKTVEELDEQNAELKRKQKEVIAQQNQAVQKAFTLEMTKIVFDGITGLVKAGADAYITCTNPLVLASKTGKELIGGGDKSSPASGTNTTTPQSGGSAPQPSSGSSGTTTGGKKPSTDPVTALAEAERAIKTLEDKITKIGEPKTDQAKSDLASAKDELSLMQDRKYAAELAISDARRAQAAANAADPSKPAPQVDGWSLARDMENRAYLLEQRQAQVAKDRLAAQKVVIENQAKLAELAVTAEYTEAHLGQIKTAVQNLAKASTTVQSLAIFWGQIHNVVKNLVTKSEEVQSPDVLACLKVADDVDFADLVDGLVKTGMLAMYGYWWAIKDICKAYVDAATSVLEAASAGNFYSDWIQVAPGSDEVKSLVNKALEKAKNNQPLIKPPQMAELKPKTPAVAASA